MWRLEISCLLNFIACPNLLLGLFLFPGTIWAAKGMQNTPVDLLLNTFALQPAMRVESSAACGCAAAIPMVLPLLVAQPSLPSENDPLCLIHWGWSLFLIVFSNCATTAGIASAASATCKAVFAGCNFVDHHDVCLSLAPRSFSGFSPIHSC